MMQNLKYVALLSLIFQSPLQGAKADATPEKIGNFLLPASMQPGPLFGFGQNIIDKHDLLLSSIFQKIGGRNIKQVTLLPYLLYGINDRLSLYTAFSYTPSLQIGQQQTKGKKDVFGQLEYAYINKETTTSNTQATAVANFSTPNGSVLKAPAVRTESGSTSFFLGGTFSYMEQWWYAWLQGGVTLMTSKGNSQFGNQYLYQSGFERCFATRPGWIFAGMVELFGFYVQKDTTDGIVINSGGNTFWIGPSLFISSKKIIFQLGVATPIAQSLFGNQNKHHHFFQINFSYRL